MMFKEGDVFEYHQINALKIPMAVETLIEGPTPDTRTIENLRLVEVSPGWEIAGSMARYTEGYYAALYFSDNARQGLRSRDLDKASAKFESLKAFQNSLRG